jgi:hypothetical protein
VSDNAVVTQSTSEQPLASVPRTSLSVEDAYTQLQERRESRTERPAKPEAVRPRALDRSPSVSDDRARWTDEEAGYIARLQIDEERWKADHQRYLQDSRIDFNALEQTNRGEAVAKRIQLADAERNLKERAERILKAREALGTIALERHAQKVLQFLTTQKEALSERLPNLDNAALRTYLMAEGFSESEVSQVYDARVVVLAEKARRYDSMLARGEAKRPTLPRVPTKRPAATAESKLDELEKRLKRSGSLTDAYAVLNARRQQGATR